MINFGALVIVVIVSEGMDLTKTKPSAPAVRLIDFVDVKVPSQVIQRNIVCSTRINQSKSLLLIKLNYTWYMNKIHTFDALKYISPPICMTSKFCSVSDLAHCITDNQLIGEVWPPSIKWSSRPEESNTFEGKRKKMILLLL